MASRRLQCLYFFLLTIFLFTVAVRCDEDDDLLQGINSHRKSKKLPELTKNDKAECIADQIVDKLENQPCARITGSNSTPTDPLQFSNYPDALKKCKVDLTHTKDGVILPVCVQSRVPTLVLTNYTESSYATYFNNSKYTGVGIGNEDAWTVVVLSTNTQAGTLASASGTAYVNVCFKCYVILLLVSLLVLVF